MLKKIIKVQDDEKLRIDLYLVSKLEESSRNHIKKLIDSQNITVNGKIVKSNFKVSYDDLIEIEFFEPKRLEVLPENIKIDIVYEDEHIIVVNKPQNMVVHPADGHYSGTLVNALLYHCKNLSGINGVLRPGIVHRIDKDTSGILVVAKTDQAHKFLAKQLQEHTMTRKYNAVVFGKLDKDEGSIDKNIGRSQKDRKKMSINYKNGKNALTHFRVLERFRKFTLIELSLETGRTHQIRVHMASIGHSILGDFQYSYNKQPIDVLGQVLHAKMLGFVHPFSKKYVEFDSKLPKYFEDVLDIIR